jgi:seryl-tRNA(Sec) selenium transferase
VETPIGTSIFDDLGVKPVINALGNWTMLGGSSPSPRLLAAIAAAGRYYVDMEELLDKSGRLIAGLVGAEAAYVTPGAAAALALGAAACMTGGDRAKMAQLPDTTGLKSEILIQKRQRYKYDRALTIFGARLLEVGDDSGTTPHQLERRLAHPPRRSSGGQRAGPAWSPSKTPCGLAMPTACRCWSTLPARSTPSNACGVSRPPGHT